MDAQQERHMLHLDALSRVHSLLPGKLRALAAHDAKRLTRALEATLRSSGNGDAGAVGAAASSGKGDPLLPAPRRGLWGEASGTSQQQHAQAEGANASSSAASTRKPVRAQVPAAHASAQSKSPSQARRATRKRQQPRRAPIGARLQRLLPAWHAAHNPRCSACGVALLISVSAAFEPGSASHGQGGKKHRRKTAHSIRCLHCNAVASVPAPTDREKGEGKSSGKRKRGAEVESIGQQPQSPAAQLPSDSAGQHERDRLQPPSQPQAARLTALQPPQLEPPPAPRLLTLDERAAQARAERKRARKSAAGAPVADAPARLGAGAAPEARSVVSPAPTAAPAMSSPDIAAPKIPASNWVTPSAPAPVTASTPGLASAPVPASAPAAAPPRPMTLDERAAAAKAAKRAARKAAAAAAVSGVPTAPGTGGAPASATAPPSASAAASSGLAPADAGKRDKAGLRALLQADRARSGSGSDGASSGNKKGGAPTTGLRSFFG